MQDPRETFFKAVGVAFLAIALLLFAFPQCVAAII